MEAPKRAAVLRKTVTNVRAGTTPAPGPVSDAGQGGRGEHEVELLLNHRVVRGLTCYMVRWRGRHTSGADEWLWLGELAHCRRRWRPSGGP